MRVTIPFLCASAVLATASFAGEPDAFQQPLAATTTNDDSWEFKLSLYAPVFGLDGTSTVGTNVLPIDLGFSDIVDNLDGGIVIAGEAQKGKFSVFGDLIWLKLSDSFSPTPNSYTGVKIEQTIGNIAFGYQIHEAQNWRLDGLVGAAYTSLDIDADLTVFPPAPAPSATRLISGNENWVDPFVGLRLRYRPSEKWRIFGRIDYGGWGVGSDLYLQGILGAGYVINDSVGIYAAYRYLSVDYSKASFAYDVDTSGPQIGLVFCF